MAQRQRRGHGEGSVYQRADGRWVGAFVVGWQQGKPRKKHVYAKTRRLVLEKLAHAQRAHTAGQPVLSERQTLAQFAARYQRDVLPALAANTRSNVEVALRLHILPALGHRRLTALRPGDLQQWLTAAAGAPRSKRQYHGVLHRLLAQAVQWGELAQNPADRVQPPKRQQAPRRVLQRHEAQAVLAAARGDPWEALLWLALTVGPREGELLALQWSDVSWQRATLTIRRNYTRGEVRVPKSAAGSRTVPLFPEVLQALERRRQDWPSAPWIFTARASGALICPSSLRGWWARLQRRAGIHPPVTMHDCRHAAGSYLLDLGMPLPQVSKILGHSSVAITASVYAHALESGDRAYVEKLGSLLSERIAVNIATPGAGDQPDVAE